MFEIKPDHLKPVNVKGLPEKITGWFLWKSPSF
jgi:hypothetical protein